MQILSNLFNDKVWWIENRSELTFPAYRWKALEGAYRNNGPRLFLYTLRRRVQVFRLKISIALYCSCLRKPDATIPLKFVKMFKDKVSHPFGFLAHKVSLYYSNGTPSVRRRPFVRRPHFQTWISLRPDDRSCSNFLWFRARLDYSLSLSAEIFSH